jgi:hypothetical protein
MGRAHSSTNSHLFIVIILVKTGCRSDSHRPHASANQHGESGDLHLCK